MTETKRLPTPEEWAAARAAWEADPMLSDVALGKRLDVSKTAVQKRRVREGWERPTDMAKVAKKAHTHADRLKAAEMVAAGVAVEREPVAPVVAEDMPATPAATPVAAAGNPPKKEQSSVVLKKEHDAPRSRHDPRGTPSAPHDPDLVERLAIDLRAAVTKRHRDEWTVARNLSYEAIKAKDFEKAKLAKITSETLKIIQDGERKAWGLDVPEGNGNAVVVIERDRAPATGG